MSDLLPQLIVLALGARSRHPCSSPPSCFWVPEGLYPTSHRPRSRVPRYLRGDGYRRTHSFRFPKGSILRATALGVGYLAICAAMGIAGLTLFAEAAGLRAPEDERR